MKKQTKQELPEELKEVLEETKLSRTVERKHKERPSKDDLMDKRYA